MCYSTSFEKYHNSEINDVSVVGYSMTTKPGQKFGEPRFEVSLKNGIKKLFSYKDSDFSSIKSIYEKIQNRRKFERYINR